MFNAFKNKVCEFIILYFLFFAVLIFFWHGYYVGWEGSAYKDALSFVSSVFNLNYSIEVSRQAAPTHVILYFPFVIFELLFLNKNTFEQLALPPLMYICFIPVVMYFVFFSFFEDKRKSILFTFVIFFTTLAFPMLNLQMEYPSMLFALVIVFFITKKQLHKRDHFFIIFFTLLLFFSRTFGSLFALSTISFYVSRFGYKNMVKEVAFNKIILFIFIFTIIVFFYYFLSQNLMERFYYELIASLGRRNILEGFYGSLFSIGKGLIIYNPLLFLVPFFWKRFYHEYKDLSVFIIFLAIPVFILNGISPAWSDERWCIRGAGVYIILLHFPLIYLLKDFSIWKGYFNRIVITLLFIASFYIQFLGAIYPYYTQRLMLYGTGKQMDSLERMRYIPALSPLFIHHHLFKSYINYKINGSPVDWEYSEISWTRFDKKRRENFINLKVNVELLHKPRSYFMFYK